MLEFVKINLGKRQILIHHYQPKKEKKNLKSLSIVRISSHASYQVGSLFFVDT